MRAMSNVSTLLAELRSNRVHGPRGYTSYGAARDQGSGAPCQCRSNRLGYEIGNGSHRSGTLLPYRRYTGGV